jgi:hypothetical protein
MEGGRGARDHFAEGERGQGPFGRGDIGLGAIVRKMETTKKGMGSFDE